MRRLRQIARPWLALLGGVGLCVGLWVGTGAEAAAPAPAAISRTKAAPAPVAAPSGAAKREVRIKIAAVGDVMFGRYGRGPKHRYRKFAWDRPFRHVKGLLSGHDISMFNCETPIAAKRYRRPYKHLSFRAPPPSAKWLSGAGFNLAITANNHAWDQGDRGVRDTIDHLSAAGLGVAGTGKTLAEAWQPWVLNKNGVKIGVLGVTALRNYSVPEKVGYVAFLHMRKVLKKLPEAVARLRPKFDFLILNLHFGSEYNHAVFRYERRLMDALQAAGVDVVIGHHPHVLRAVEFRPGGKLADGRPVRPMAVFYSMGNFLMDFGFKNTKPTGVAQVTLVKRGDERRIEQLRFIPVMRHWDGLPRPATHYTGYKIRRLMSRISRRLWAPNRVSQVGEGFDFKLGKRFWPKLKRPVWRKRRRRRRRRRR